MREASDEVMSARVQKLPRCLWAFFLACALLLSTATLAAAAGVEPSVADEETQGFFGYFAERKYIREEPRANTKRVARVPANTTLLLIPVSERYALATYDGKTGYVFYGDVVLAEPAETPAAKPPEVTEATKTEAVGFKEFIGYSKDALFAYAGAHGAEWTGTIYPPLTPLHVVGRAGELLQIEAEGGPLYVDAARVVALPGDAAVAPYEAYLREAALLFAYPLAGADVPAVLPPPSYLVVTAHNGQYARVELGDGVGGYVALSALRRPEAMRSQARLGFLKAPVPLYSAPNSMTLTNAYMKAGSLVTIDASGGGFSRVGEDLYVKTEAVSLLYPKKSKPFFAFWKAPQPLYANTSGVLLPTGEVLPENTVVELSEGLGNFYLVRQDGMLGFVTKQGMQAIEHTRSVAPMAAFAPSDVPLKEHPFEASPVTATLPAGACLWLSEKVGGLYRIAVDGAAGYADASAFEIIGESVAVRSLEVYLHADAALTDFPHEGGGVVARLPSNTLARAVAQNGGYYYIQHPDGEGYIPQHSAWPLDDRRREPDTYQQKYYLFLNKATRALTVYRADAEGNRTDEAVFTTIAAIGKATTPTPSGIFTLGKKERWRQFGETSFAPFVIYFAPGRYAHGPLFASQSERALKEARLVEFGAMASGGCIRMPYDDALWIYANCMSGDTKLEIVSGE